MNHQTTANILVVDDTPENLRLLIGILREQGYKVRSASNGPRAIATAQMHPPGVILLDIMMPEMDGYEVCKRLKADERTREIPIIFISGLDEVLDKVKAFLLGGVDYITKPFQSEEVLARVQTHLTIRNQHQQLQEQQARFRALSNAAFEGIVIHDNGHILDVNQMIETMFGYSHAELIGKHVLDFVSPEHHELVSTHIRAGDEKPYEAQGIKKDGTVFPIEVQAKTMPYQGREVKVDAVRDLSQQKAMEVENEQLHHENLTLKTTMKERYRFGEIIGRSPAMQEVYELVTRAAASEANVLIYGESGTGKDLIAQTIQQLSQRKENPFIPVNCGSIQDSLFESEFFGHRKGAFTGAVRDKIGFFDAAHTGTLFLDEIGELPLAMQVKLLRAIEGKGYTPLGDHQVKHADARILAATNRNLQEQIQQGTIREDFFYRINVITIHVPPLRERREDIPLLVEFVLEQYSSDTTPQDIPGHVLASLYNHGWPGNIRQLQNVVQRYLTLNRLDFGDGIFETESEEALLRDISKQDRTTLQEVMEEVEKRFITKMLEQNRWQKRKTAAKLDIDVKTLYRKMKKYQLE